MAMIHGIDLFSVKSQKRSYSRAFRRCDLNHTKADVANNGYGLRLNRVPSLISVRFN